VLKRYYTRLFQCLPQDYVKTVNKLKQISPAGVSADCLNQLRRLPSTEMINEAIIASVLNEIATHDNVFSFCDIMECLSDQNSLIECLRNGT